MKYPSLKIALITLFAGALFFTFQNCSGGFAPVTSQLTGASTGSSASSLSFKISTATPAALTGNDLIFHLDGLDAFPTAKVVWSSTFSGATPCTNDVNDDSRLDFAVNCTVAGNIVVKADVTLDTGEQQSGTFAALVALNPNPTPTGGGNMIFHIPAGTGTKPWNTAATAPGVYVGQTLVIQNDDTTPHQLHVERYEADPALNGHPCQHGENPIPPGGSYNCVITKSYTEGVDPIIWDHFSGTSARFYIKACDGGALYTKTCMGCHGALATSAVKGKTFAQIKSALSSVPAMSGITLTDLQAHALEFVLK